MHKYFLTLLLIANTIICVGQEWFDSSIAFDFSEMKSLEDTSVYKFEFLEGSRTNNELISFNSISKNIIFSYSTMGGNKPILFISKGNEKMEIQFLQIQSFAPADVDSYNYSQKVTKLNFENGLFILNNNKLTKNTNNKRHSYSNDENIQPTAYCKTPLETSFKYISYSPFYTNEINYLCELSKNKKNILKDFDKLQTKFESLKLDSEIDSSKKCKKLFSTVLNGNTEIDDNHKFDFCIKKEDNLITVKKLLKSIDLDDRIFSYNNKYLVVVKFDFVRNNFNIRTYKKEYYKIY